MATKQNAIKTKPLLVVKPTKTAKAPKRSVRKVAVRKAKKKPAAKRAMPNRADAIEVVAPPETTPIRKPRKKPREDDYAVLECAHREQSNFTFGRCPFATTFTVSGCAIADRDERRKCYMRYDGGWNKDTKFAPDWCPLRQGEVTVRLVEDRPPPVASDSDGNEKSSVLTIRVDLLEIEKPRRR